MGKFPDQVAFFHNFQMLEITMFEEFHYTDSKCHLLIICEEQLTPGFWSQINH